MLASIPHCHSCPAAAMQDCPGQPGSSAGQMQLLAVGGVVAAVLAAWLQLLVGSSGERAAALV